MDQLTIDRIKKFHPKFRDELLKQYNEANNRLGKGARLRFSYVLRTPQEQTELYAQGRTRPGPKVTNAKAWQSIHNYGLAFDIVILYDNNEDGKFEEASWSRTRDFDKDGKADWTEIVEYFKSKGWSWGGDWRGNLKDYPHFEKPGFNWRDLKKKVEY